MPTTKRTGSLTAMQKAMTWVRDGKFADADKLFQEIAETAHAKEQDFAGSAGLPTPGPSIRQTTNAALKYLQSAEESLGHRSAISKSDKDEELSRILRNRTVRAAHAGNPAIGRTSL